MTIPFYVLLVLTSSIGAPTNVASIATFQTEEECLLVSAVVEKRISQPRQFDGVIGERQTEVVCEEVSK